MDMLFRFNVARIAATVISGEISEAIGDVGSPFHLCILTWTLLFGGEDLLYNGISLPSFCAVVFVLATLYKLLSRIFSKQIDASFLMSVSDQILKVLSNAGLNIALMFVAYYYIFWPVVYALASVKLLLGEELDDTQLQPLGKLIVVGTAIAFVLLIRRFVMDHKRALLVMIPTEIRGPGPGRRKRRPPYGDLETRASSDLPLD